MRDLLLSTELILEWGDRHHARRGRWPSVKSGLVIGGLGDTWRNVDNALRYGLRGLPGGSSLGRFFAQHRNARNRTNTPPLVIDTILKWARAHRRRTGKLPHLGSGPVLSAPGESWGAINHALQTGGRGLPGGTTLGQLLAERLGVRNYTNIPPLNVEQILVWADRFHRRTGRWPNHQSGPIPNSGGETWSAVENALLQGYRGLPGGSSLYKLFKEHRQIAGPRPPVRQKLSRRGRQGRRAIRLNLTEDIIARYRAGQLTVGDIAGEFDVSPDIARRSLVEAGVPIRGRGRRPGRRPAEHKMVIRLYRGGLSLKAIGVRVGLSAGRVSTILERYGIDRRPAGPAFLVFDMTPTDRERWAAHLRQARSRAGLTQDEVCSKTGLHQATVSALENARQAPTRRTVSKLAAALRVRLSDLSPSRKM